MNAPYAWAGSGPHKLPLPLRIKAWWAYSWHWVASIGLIVGIVKSAQIFEWVRHL